MTGIESRANEEQGTVFIIDDDPSICEGLSNLLEAVGIGAETYESAESFRTHWKGPRAGCLLLDARLPGMNGVEFQEELKRAGVAIPIVFMTAHGDMPMVRKVMKAGAVEFLIKPFQKEELLQAVAQAFELDRSRRREESIVNSIRVRIDSLTDREREVMGKVIEGKLNKQIAAELNLSEVTIKLHRRHVMEGMQASSLADLVRMCERVRTPPGNSGDTNSDLKSDTRP